MNSEINETIGQSSYKELVEAIGKALSEGRDKAIQTVNATLIKTNWQIGHYIVEYEQKGKERAEYGAELLNRLSHDLTVAYGKGFSRSNVFQMRQFYLAFPKIQTLSGQLSWSHYLEILKAGNELEISFYTKQCEIEKWSVRELKRQMKSGLFQRLALSRNKEEVLTLSRQGQEIQNPQDIVKDPFVLEFVGIPEKQVYLEGELEDRLIANLQDFLLELLCKPLHNEFQQITGNVLYQLLLYVSFVCLFFRSCQVEDIRVFQQVIGKVALWCRECGCKIVYLVVADLPVI